MAGNEIQQSQTQTSGTGFGENAQYGLASLLLGCTILLAALLLMDYSAGFAYRGPIGLSLGVSYVTAIIVLMIGACLSVVGLAVGVTGLLKALTSRQPLALPLSGAAASLAGFVLWLIAGIGLIAVLNWFPW